MSAQNNHILTYTPISESLDFFYFITKDIQNPENTIKRCLSILYADGFFLQAVTSILQNYDGFSEDGCYWYYPDMNSPFEEDRFDGVKFAVGFDDPESTVYVSEEECFEYTEKACRKFLSYHPEFTDYINSLISNWKPLPCIY